MDKYLACDFLPNIVIHNTLFVCGRMAGWGTWNPRRAALGSTAWLVPVRFYYGWPSWAAS